MIANTGIILLAAGESSRMGEPKQLLRVEGQPMVRHAAGAALASTCRPVIVVAGAHETLVRRALADLPVQIAANPDWEGGMGTSIQAGLRLLPDSVSGVILALADQPLITGAIYDGLIQRAIKSGKPMVASQYAGTVGVPVYFARTFFPNLFGLQPAQGCKGIVLSHPSEALLVDLPEAAIDIDTVDDYNAFRSV